MDLPPLVLRRLASMRLVGAVPSSPGEIVKTLGAIQCQDYHFGAWSVGQRCGATLQAIDRAFAEGHMLRTHILRPTWHFVHPDDIRWLLDVTAPRVLQVSTKYCRRQGLDEDIVTTCLKLMTEALEADEELTRPELSSVLSQAGFDLPAGHLSLLLLHTELLGLVCSGPPNGSRQTYALLERRAPNARRLSPEEGLRELTFRYFASHGPATPQDLSWWSSLPIRDVKRGIELSEDDLDSITTAGVTYWVAPSEGPAVLEPRAQLLQTWDELFVGYSSSKYLADLEGLTATKGAGIYNPSILLDGQIVGRWRTRRTAGALRVEVTLYRRLPRPELDPVEDAIGRYGSFLETSVDATFVPLNETYFG